jgi:amino acid transporter
MLSNKFRIPGYVLTLTGLLLAVLYFTMKLRFEIPVFAFVSSYLKTKYFTTFSTNFADESIFLFLLAGLSLLVFSKEKDEKELFTSLRYKAIVSTIIINICFLAFSVIFIYGSGFLVMVLINAFLPFIVYLLVFNIMKFQEIRNRKLV